MTHSGAIGYRQFIFSIYEPEEINASLSDSLEDYFQAISFELACSGRYDDFFFKFTIAYFEVNPDDYFNMNGYDWVYSASDIMKLKDMPYNKNWMYEKLV